jgi:hypothetical protein
MAPTGTSTASTGEMLEVGGMRMTHLAPAPAQQATVEPTALLIPAKPLLPPLTTGPTVTSTASTVGTSEGLRGLARARLATWVTEAPTAQLAL